MLAMWPSTCSIALMLAFVHSIRAMPHSASFPSYRDPAENATFDARNLMSRQGDDGFDPSDLSFITRLAAIGDSYSAGIGAGDRLGLHSENGGQTHWRCSRYDHAYPNLINNDPRLGDPANRKFQFQSCSGAVIADVINTQIPLINPNQQVILLSAGGNDIGLLEIMNQCIFQFAVLNAEQVIVAKYEAFTNKKFKFAEDFDFDAAGMGCEGQLEASRKLIDSPTFSSNLDALLQAAKNKLEFAEQGGMIYYTGYAKFWAEDLTTECDSVTWSTWIYDLYNSFQRDQKLTRSHRRTMNELVDAVNAKIAIAVEKAGNRVKFVDYDQYVGYFNGRFCEAGVDEATKESETRQGLMFYEMSTWDVFGGSPWKRDTNGVPSDTFVGRISQLAQLTLLIDPKAQLVNEHFIESGQNDILSAAFAAPTESKLTILGFEVPNMLPDGYGRVFHPKILLHELIANLVIYHMVDWNSQHNGFAAIPEQQELSTCLYHPPTTEPTTRQGQQIAIASYINPLGDPASWQRLLEYDASKVSVLVANVLNGPDYVVNTAWKSVIDQIAAGGKTIIGYVRTRYLGVSKQRFTTRLGSHDLADWASQIEQDIDKWFELYGTSLGGIFFDEGWPECGPNIIYADLYAYINNYTKRKHPGAFTVLNPGSPIAQCFEDTMDTLLTFESSFETYTSKYVPNDWTPKDPRKIWHIIYRVPQDQVAAVAALALTRHAGLLEMTDDDNPNPYDTLSNSAYMEAAVNAVAGGKPHITSPAEATGSQVHVAGIPSDSIVSSSDYSSVTLGWSAVGDALGYAVYMNGTQILELPPSLNRATIGMIEPGTANIAFEVRTVLASGDRGGSPRSISASTKELPKNGTMTNISFERNGGSVTYTADVLVPYAFVRLFLGVKDVGMGIAHGWPIEAEKLWGAGTQLHEVVNYLVEGNEFYSGFFKYSGTWYEASKNNADWGWAPIGTAPQQQNGYTHTWVVPIAGTDIDPKEYVIQGQGYAPVKNVLMGSTRFYQSTCILCPPK
ncbi:hypothetical protein WAI453_013651 [Rhynchosporium graminicola]